MQLESGAIRRIRYDRERGKLFVRFSDGGEYLYVGVPEEVHRSLVEVPSRGHFFACEIRDRYPYNRLHG